MAVKVGGENRQRLDGRLLRTVPLTAFNLPQVSRRPTTDTITDDIGQIRAQTPSRSTSHHPSPNKLFIAPFFPPPTPKQSILPLPHRLSVRMHLATFPPFPSPAHLQPPEA